MKIYVDANYADSDFRCYTANPDNLYREVEHTFFDGKCAEFIEGYRFVPSGETGTREDGTVFTGEMIAPWKDYNELDSAQRIYERQLLAEYEESLKVMGVKV